MALGNFLKKDKPKKEEKKGKDKTSLEVSKIKKEIKDVEAVRLLKFPHITEKATDLAKKNQYVFKIWPGVNKVEVKKAIENLYGVDVLGVKIINIPPKRRRLGRIRGWRKGYKKAIVRLKEGQKIELLPR